MKKTTCKKTIALAVMTVIALSVPASSYAAVKAAPEPSAAARGFSAPPRPGHRPPPPPPGHSYRPAPPPPPPGHGYRPAPPPPPPGHGYRPAPPPPPPGHGYRPAPPPPPRGHHHRDSDKALAIGGALFLLGTIINNSNNE
ncbi:MAG: hypothetical protein SOZ52_06740 [Pyramidobacter sp.]|nr:hypothetical protein [Pyramidobacter sp.]